MIPMMASVTAAVENPVTPTQRKPHASKVIESENIFQLMQQQALPELIHSMTQEKNIKRLLITSTAGDIHDHRANPYLVKAYEETNEEGVRCKLLQSMGQFHDPALFTWFVRRLKNPSIGIQCFAIWALGELRTPKAVEPLRRKLRSSNRNVQMTAIDALGKTGKNAELASELGTFLADDDAQIRFIVAQALRGTAGVDMAPEIMKRLMDEPSLDVQEALAGTLGHVGGMIAAEHFIELLKNPPTQATEHWAELGLAAGDADIVIPVLTPLLNSGDLSVRLSATRLLKGFGKNVEP